MKPSDKSAVHDFLVELLKQNRDQRPLADSAPIFTSGRLDSFSLMQAVMHLEEAFGVDFSGGGFDMELLDSVDLIEALIDKKGRPG